MPRTYYEEIRRVNEGLRIWWEIVKVLLRRDITKARGLPFYAFWVRENGAVKGEHWHLLVHCPLELRPTFDQYFRGTFTNAAQAGLWFATFCLSPWARKIEAEFARSVFPADGPFEMK